MLAHRQSLEHAGEQAISASVTTTQPRFLRKQNCAGPRASPREAASRCVCQRRDSNPLFPVVRSIRNLHHQRRFSRERRQTRLKTNFIRGARSGAATANPLGFALPSVSGLRLVPSDRPRASGHAPAGASPGIRVSRSGLRRDVSNEPCFGQQKSLRSGWLGRVRESGLSMPLTRDRSHEPGVRHRSA